jgi:hypothetical protein
VGKSRLLKKLRTGNFSYKEKAVKKISVRKQKNTARTAGFKACGEDVRPMVKKPEGSFSEAGKNKLRSLFIVFFKHEACSFRGE